MKSIDRIMEASVDELTAIEDIGPRIAESIISYFSVQENRNIVRRLKDAGVNMSVPENVDADRSDLLAGKTIVISGTFSKHSRDEYKELIENNGGKNSGSISKKTDYVLAGENMGPAKLEKAKSLGIPVIDEDTFLIMIEKQS